MRPLKDWYAAYRKLKKSDGGQMIFLDYEVDMTPRWTDGVGNPHIAKIIRDNQSTYEKNLKEIANLDVIAEIIKDAEELNWRNGFVPAVDAFTLIWGALKAPKTYMEVGSGNSTMFVKAALSRVESDVKIVSIDPFPRKEIDQLIGSVERQGYTIAPLALYWLRGRAKLKIGLAKGKKMHDKRQTIKDRDWKRDQQRIMKGG